jgi:hypothetical protein
MIIQKHTHTHTHKQQATNYFYYHLEKFQHRLAWENTNTYIDKNYRRNFIQLKTNRKKRLLRCKKQLQTNEGVVYEEMRKPQQQTTDPIHELV